MKPFVDPEKTTPDQHSFLILRKAEPGLIYVFTETQSDRIHPLAGAFVRVVCCLKNRVERTYRRLNLALELFLFCLKIASRYIPTNQTDDQNSAAKNPER
ncbi:MAG: hypothetical protein K8R36_22445, partial [Planctomycetales bacterium]|nr:hypothetical protein [Planctomycetales bacterium]